FEAILEVGVKEKVLEESEKRFIEGVLKFNDLSVRSVMTPRLKMYTLSSSTKIVTALQDLVREGYSRIPITSGSKDQIVGVVHLRDVLKAVSEGRREMKLKAIARKPVFVSREKLLSELLKEFQGRGEHMAIVVDEYSGVEGLVTLEDILEEVFGEIADEKDVSPLQMVRLDNNTALVHGETDIRLVNEFLNLRMEKGDDYSTISGFLHDHLQDIPKQGDKVELEDGMLLVESVRGNVPVRVKVSRNMEHGSGSA
ncbi:MAG: hemolysin family protein, partial [Nitrososphaerales archaeon]